MAWNWVSVTTKQGGTTIPKPGEMVELNYQISICECSCLGNPLKGKEILDAVCHTSPYYHSWFREMMKVEKVGKSEKVLDRLRSEMDTLGRNGDRYVAGSDL